MSRAMIAADTIRELASRTGETVIDTVTGVPSFARGSSRPDRSTRRRNARQDDLELLALAVGRLDQRDRLRRSPRRPSSRRAARRRGSNCDRPPVVVGEDRVVGRVDHVAEEIAPGPRHRLVGHVLDCPHQPDRRALIVERGDPARAHDPGGAVEAKRSDLDAQRLLGARAGASPTSSPARDRRGARRASIASSVTSTNRSGPSSSASTRPSTRPPRYADRPRSCRRPRPARLGQQLLAGLPVLVGALSLDPLAQMPADRQQHLRELAGSTIAGAVELECPQRAAGARDRETPRPPERTPARRSRSTRPARPSPGRSELGSEGCARISAALHQVDAVQQLATVGPPNRGALEPERLAQRLAGPRAPPAQASRERESASAICQWRFSQLASGSGCVDGPVSEPILRLRARRRAGYAACAGIFASSCSARRCIARSLPRRSTPRTSGDGDAARSAAPAAMSTRTRSGCRRSGSSLEHVGAVGDALAAGADVALDDRRRAGAPTTTSMSTVSVRPPAVTWT